MEAGHQQLVHTPFVPSGYWNPCAPLVWDQGFPTPLDELTLSTGPVKAPDIRFSSSQFHKQHALHGKAVSHGVNKRLFCLYIQLLNRPSELHISV
ncbi:unnamed protein product [Schistosoma margrebowiei]|uniref:Uncharacterized protein n=1 Tax=Schistosoma margrebowiei TaxID=48269 RepID=A0A183LG42_9TREM|nr:unnamed protein product [Schistosoma margrebowiei]